MKQLSVDGIEIAYLDEGKGPAVIIGHCSSASHKEWLPLIETLKADWRVLAPDFIGYGQSAPWPADEPFSVGADVDVVLAVAKKTKGKCISSAIPMARRWCSKPRARWAPREKPRAGRARACFICCAEASRMGRGRDARPRRARCRGKRRRPRRRQVLHDLLARPLALVVVAGAFQGGDRGDDP